MGWRLVGYKKRDRVRLASGNGLDHTRRFGEVAAGDNTGWLETEPPVAPRRPQS